MPNLTITGTMRFPVQLLRASGIPAGLVAVFYNQAPDVEEELGRFDKIEAESFTATVALKDTRSVNLVVRLFAPDRKDALAETPPQYGVRNAASVVLDYPDPLANLPEYDRLVALLSPYLHGRSLASLSEKERAALTGLAGVKAAVLAQLLAAANHAAELQKLMPQLAPQAPPRPAKKAPAGAPDMVAPLYAFVKTFGDVPLAGLVLHSRTVWKQTLDRAAADKTIQAQIAPALAAIVETLAAARDALHFNLTDDGQSSDAKVIFWVPATAEVRSQLLDAVLDLTRPQAAIDAAASLTPAQKTLFAQAFRLFEALGRYGPMLAVLAQPRHGRPPIFTADGAGLAQDLLHGMGGDDWRALVAEVQAGHQAGFPAAYRDKPQPEAAYAKDIVANIAAQDPARNLATRLAATAIDGAAELAAILDAHPAFDIKTESAGSYFARAAVGSATARASDTQIKRIAAVQRAIKLAPDGDVAVAATLLTNNYSSSFDILKDGRATFARKLFGKLAANAVDAIYAQAKRNFATAYATSLRLMPPSADLPFLPLSGDLRASNLKNAAPPPTLKTLFGSADFCACEQCQSVYGAAAYLADLLHWMQTDLLASSQTDALHLLDLRRPDITQILLNCHNTNTTIPYIDLVNEILSYALLASNNRPPLGNLQTVGATEDLLLKPEHRFPAAEKLLSTVNVSWRLPFDPIFDETRAYLDALGWDHAALVWALSAETWAARSALEKSTWAAAYLGLVAEEFQIVTSINAAASDFWRSFWGLGSAPGPMVGPLLDTHEFADVAALETLLKTDYAASSAESSASFLVKKIAFPPDAPCDLDKAFLVDISDQQLTLTPAAADRLMRFERLRRRAAELSVAQLDLALRAFGFMKIDADFVVRLAAAVWVARRLKGSIDDVLIWWLPGADPRAAFTKALGLSSSDFAAAVALMAPSYNPLAGPEAALRFVLDLDRLRTVTLPPTQIRDMLTGTGKWELVAGRARDAGLAADAKVAWQEMENSIGPTVEPDANGVGVSEIDAPTSILPDRNDPALTPQQKRLRQFRELLDLALATAVGLAPATATKLIDGFVWAVTPGSSEPDILDPIGTPAAERLIAVPMSGAAWRARFSTPRISKSVAGATTLNRDWHVANPAVDVEAMFTPMYRYLLHIARLARAAGLDQDGLDYLVTAGSMSDLFNIASLLALARAVTQAKALGLTQVAYLSNAANAQPGSGSSTGSSATTTVAERMTNAAIDPGGLAGWLGTTMGETSVLAGQASPDLAALAMQARTVETGSDIGAVTARMITLSHIAADLSLPVDQIVALVWTAPHLATARSANRLTQTQADALRAVLYRQAGDAAAWTRLIQPIQNRLRANLRDALVAYYLGQQPSAFPDVDALYQQFLIDPEMEACMKTSRIVLAISSVQRLIQRALLGLEPNVSLDERDKQEWEWRKNYRVWEANRKVFLYPENWIDPSLRLETSPFFAEAQDQLLQDELNGPNVEKVFNTYLSKLLEVARLDIRGLYVENNERGRTLHVFGRTWNPPFVYYYRRRDTDRRWSPWEKLDLDIEGDHLIPVIFNRRLYLFWPQFTEKEHKTIELDNKPAPYIEVRMCYSKREFGKWTSKKQLEGTLIAGSYAGPGVNGDMNYKLTGFDDHILYGQLVSLDPDSFFLWGDVSGKDLIVHVLRWADDPTHPNIVPFLCHVMAFEDEFLTSACDERLEIKVALPPSFHPYYGLGRIARPNNTLPKAMQLTDAQNRIGYGDPTWLRNSISVRTQALYIVGTSDSIQILGNAHLPYTLTYPHQYQHALAGQPFFLSDRRYTHFVDSTWLFGNLFVLVQLHEHPYCCLMLSELHRFGVEGLLAPKDDGQNSNPLRRQQLTESYFQADYQPNTSTVVPHYPVKSFDFSRFGAYSIYNWEVFFHLPALIGHQLHLDGKYAEAILWLSFVFDPTNREATPGASRFWMLKPFYERVSPGSIATLMQLLAGTASTPAEQQQREELAAEIDYWRRHPFEPHAVAEMRMEAYMRWTVMEYIAILIDWGDTLFRQDTMESVNEATQLYMLAAEILGQRPRKVEGTRPRDRSYADLAANLDQFSNAAVALEDNLAGVISDSSATDGSGATPIALHFCIPENPQLMEYWERVENRLFNIRHCRDIDGKSRDLPLFAPPIDPALLVKAKAAGLDLADVLDNLFAPNPCHRFGYLLARAADFCNEVKSLGAQLLAALEKQDAEGLAELRQMHEQNILRASRNIKTKQVDEAKQSLAAAESSRKLAEIRLSNYSGRAFMIGEETTAKSLTEEAHQIQLAEQGMMLVSSYLSPYSFSIGTSGNGVHWTANLELGLVPRIVGQALGALASAHLNSANRALTSASYTRRQEDWNLQIKLANEEIPQAEKQIAAAEIRLAIAEKDLDNHDLQVAQSSAVLDWMRDKFTSEKLYGWMSGELKTLHGWAYGLAFDLAKQAQKAFELEFGRTEQYIQFGLWDSARQGLLAGERLSVQLRELEAAYMRSNTREFELTRSISLRLLDPFALMTLRSNKSAQFELPEWLLQMEFPDMNLYAMRVKSVAVSLPCVTGPYTPTNVKLRLVNHKIGWSPGPLAPTWLPADMINEIITSSAVNDPALFEANLRDERYLPFENAGVVSRWEVSLPLAPQFDYQTISDLVLHIRFVAKGQSLPTPATQPALPILTDGSIGHVLLSWRHDFPDGWRQLGAAIEASASRAVGSSSGLPVGSSHALAAPAVDLGLLPYRLRLQRGPSTAAPAAQYAWVLFRDAQGNSALSKEIDISGGLTVIIKSKSNSALRLDNANPSNPALVYDTPAGAGLPVDDVILQYKVT